MRTMTRGKYRKKREHRRKQDLAETAIVNSTSQQPNPDNIPSPSAQRPEATMPKRLPSTVGEIVMTVFVGATAFIYVCLTVLTNASMRIDQRAWVGFGTIKPMTLDE